MPRFEFPNIRTTRNGVGCSVDAPPRPFSKGQVPTKLKAACSILIVEDDQKTRDALMLILSRLGYHAVGAGTVAEGLAQLDGQHGAILDLNLPDGLGTVILHRIRSENRPMRVAIASATSDDDLWSEAKNGGADILLRKPFDVNMLLAWLETVG